MSVEVLKSTLQDNYKVALKILGNKHIADDNSYLTMCSGGGNLYLRALGTTHDLKLKIADIDEEQSASLNYKHFGSMLNVLEDNVTLEFFEDAVKISDGSASAKLEKKVIVDDVDLGNVSERVEYVKENGYKIEIDDFLKALVYLHGLSGESDEDELLGDIYFANGIGFVVDSRYVVRFTYELPFELILDRDTAGILLEFLKTGTEGLYFYVLPKGDGSFDFVVGDSLYSVARLSTHVKNIDSITESIDPKVIKENDYEIFNLEIDFKNFIRYIDLAVIFLADSNDEDVVCKVSDGKGRILSETGKSNSDGVFDAVGVDDVTFGLNAMDVTRLFKGLKGLVDNSLKFTINADVEIAHIVHERGDILMSVSMLD